MSKISAIELKLGNSAQCYQMQPTSVIGQIFFFWYQKKQFFWTNSYHLAIRNFYIISSSLIFTLGLKLLATTE